MTGTSIPKIHTGQGNESRDDDDHKDASSRASSARYANLGVLSSFFPAADPCTSEARQARPWYSRQDFVLRLGLIVAVVIFLINTVTLIVFRGKFPNSTIYKGDCRRVGVATSVLHGVINLLSTLLLATSNKSMQVLAAPTREEVDQAHSKFVWLDIGVPSVRNISYIAKSRMWMWLLLGISSLPLHFLYARYNSSIYSTKASNNVNILSVTPEFIKGGSVSVAEAQATASTRKKIYTIHRSQENSFQFINGTVDRDWGLGDGWDFDLQKLCDQSCIIRYQQQAMEGEFSHKLTKEDCLKRYLTAFGNRQDLLVVSTVDSFEPSRELDVTSEGNSLLFFQKFTGIPSNGRYWPCGSTNILDCRKRDGFTADELASWNIIGYNIDYCLSRERNVEDQCKLNYNTPFLIIVCVANLFKCIGLVWTIYLQSSGNGKWLITVGDGIASFLDRGDPSTHDMCLLDKMSLKQSASSTLSFSFCKSFPCIQQRKIRRSTWSDNGAREWRPSQRRYFRFASKGRWTAAMTAYLLLAMYAIFNLYNGLVTIKKYARDVRIFVDLGFGTMNEYARGYLNIKNSSVQTRLFCIALLANTGQFLSSMFYVQSISILSSMLAEREWNQYATYRKPLRVTVPVGVQRSSYFISVPWKFSIPTLLASWALHFVFSQGLFLVVIETIAGDGKITGIQPTMAFSAWPIITAIIVLIFMLGYLIAVASRTQICKMPRGATCSAIIAAACHQPLPDDQDASRFPLKWGAITDEEVRFRLALTGMDIVQRKSTDSTSTGESEALDLGEHNFIQKSGIKWIKPGHCCFSTARDLKLPTPGSIYI